MGKFHDPEYVRAYYRAYYAKRKTDPAFLKMRAESSQRSRIRHPFANKERQWTRRLGRVLPPYAEMYETQQGRCMICFEPHPVLHLDHDHETGKTRGLLCGNCNRALGLMKDQPDRLTSGAFYLSYWDTRTERQSRPRLKIA